MRDNNKNNERVSKYPENYRQSQQIIEYQFGTIKRHRQFDYVLMRGKEKVLGEVYLAFTVYNLGRSMSILGFSELLKRIKAVFASFSSKIKLRECVILGSNNINFRLVKNHSKWCQQSLVILRG